MVVKLDPQVFIDKTGDIERSRELVGFALNQRNILKNLMSFGDLKQDQRRVEMTDGSVITVQSCFGIDKVWISSPLVVIPVEDKPEWKYIAYFVASSGSYSVAFSWDIAANKYSSLVANNGAVLKEDGLYYQGVKYGNTGLPWRWEISPAEGLDGINIFRRWMWEGFEWIRGEVSAIENVGEAQKVTANFDSTLGGSSVKIGKISYATSERMFDINAVVAIGDYAINTDVVGGPLLWAKIIGIIDEYSVILDRQIFGNYGDWDKHILISPFLPMFRMNRSEVYSYGPIRKFICYNGEYASSSYRFHGPETKFATLNTSNFATAPSAVIDTYLPGDQSRGSISFTNYGEYETLYYNEDGSIQTHYIDYLDDDAVTNAISTSEYYEHDNNLLATDKHFTYQWSADWDLGIYIGEGLSYVTPLGNFTSYALSRDTNYATSVTSLLTSWMGQLTVYNSVYNEKIIFQAALTGEHTNPGYAMQSINCDISPDTVVFNEIRSPELEKALADAADLLREAAGESASVPFQLHLYRR